MKIELNRMLVIIVFCFSSCFEGQFSQNRTFVNSKMNDGIQIIEYINKECENFSSYTPKYLKKYYSEMRKACLKVVDEQYGFENIDTIFLQELFGGPSNGSILTNITIWNDDIDLSIMNGMTIQNSNKDYFFNDSIINNNLDRYNFLEVNKAYNRALVERWDVFEFDSINLCAKNAGGTYNVYRIIIDGTKYNIDVYQIESYIPKMQDMIDFYHSNQDSIYIKL